MHLPVRPMALGTTVVHRLTRTAAHLAALIHASAPGTHARERPTDTGLDLLEIAAVAAADDGIGLHARDAPGAVDVEGYL